MYNVLIKKGKSEFSVLLSEEMHSFSLVNDISNLKGNNENLFFFDSSLQNPITDINISSSIGKIIKHGCVTIEINKSNYLNYEKNIHLIQLHNNFPIYDSLIDIESHIEFNDKFIDIDSRQIDSIFFEKLKSYFEADYIEFFVKKGIQIEKIARSCPEGNVVPWSSFTAHRIFSSERSELLCKDSTEIPIHRTLGTKKINSSLGAYFGNSNSILGCIIFESINKRYNFKDLQNLLYLSNQLTAYFCKHFSGNLANEKAFNIADPRVLADLDRLTNTDEPITIVGETGTGKEILARYIHDSSKRSSKKFSCLNCSSYPENLLESELNGTTPNAYTNATDRDGIFKYTEGGTVFLDEISSMPLNSQASFLRILQEKKIRKLGSNKEEKIDARIIVATNEPLEKLVKRGIFRMDLNNRIGFYTINLKSLRDRSHEEFFEFGQHLINFYSTALKKENITFSNEVWEDLKKYSWPGNNRQFDNIIKRIIILSDNDTVLTRMSLNVLAPEIFTGQEKQCEIEEAFIDNLTNKIYNHVMNKQNLISFETLQKELSRDIYIKVLNSFKTNKQACEILGISPANLNNKKKSLGIDYIDEIGWCKVE
ncbi:sigma 54-interacting transcriptional regulator [Myxococcota bacterium]|nr:sigma 54-interacting transcriptional regulator [Myxococcota bacterium]MBU1381839.1 sigma 54-interacting transcriptional regulator [Myxococcota bacterium]MBU1499040.1 sigma 54-interacting transcriptional regulator [Myxococcota bacterium]